MKEENKEWHETKEGKEAFLKALNERFLFTKDGEMIPKNEDSYQPIILSDYYGDIKLKETKESNMETSER